MHQWEVVEESAPDIFKVIENGVIDYGRNLASDGRAKPLACVVRENDKIIAGVSGRTEYDRLFVNYVWVAEEFRCKGIGTKLLEEIEYEAKERGCNDSLIETLDDRVSLLYSRVGYMTVAEIPFFVGPFTRYIMKKTIGG